MECKIGRLSAAHLLIIRSAIYHSFGELPPSSWKWAFMMDEIAQVNMKNLFHSNI